MSNKQTNPKRFIRAIARSGLTIYDPIDRLNGSLWIPSSDLEALLNASLRGISLRGLPLRTRSKAVKQNVCRGLGYPIPSSFKKTKPRFPGQDFDTYTQKSDNLQVWNEELQASRRYVIIRVTPDDVIERVRVVTGDVLARFDTTGTLTQKYQARLIPGEARGELVTNLDTAFLRPLTSSRCAPDLAVSSPLQDPVPGEILPIQQLYDRLIGIVGEKLEDAGSDQERNRGAQLHREVCGRLGYRDYQDDGRFPDIRHQLLEIKLQTSPTIDLGLVCPNSTDPLYTAGEALSRIRHCDVRYALFYGVTDGNEVTITNVYLTTGEGFFNRFPQFQGKVINRKIQIPLPSGFFD